jgi:hypothetical protein
MNKKKSAIFKGAIIGLILGIFLFILSSFLIPPSASPFYFCPDYSIMKGAENFEHEGCSFYPTPILTFLIFTTVFGAFISWIISKKRKI